jgi:eukaryotic-like serine/threonine-protein kinase
MNLLKLFFASILFLSLHQGITQEAAVGPDFDELPGLIWKFSSDTSFFGSPVVENGIVYAGGLDSILYALNLENGNLLWKFSTSGEIRSSVCLDKEYLFLNGGDGYLYKLNRTNGNIVWKFRTNGEKKYDFADYFHSTPMLYNGVVYFGSGDGIVYAVSEENGDLKWQFMTGGIVHTTPAIVNGRLFIGSFDGNVYALDAIRGSLLWKFKTVGHRYFQKGEVQGSPAAYNNLIFVGARDYNVYAIDQQKGFCHWNKSFTKGWGLCNNIHDSILYIGSADERVLIAADPSTGNEFWQKKMEFLVFGNNAYSINMMYLGTTIGKLHGINLKTGDKIWSFESDGYKKNRFKYFKEDDSYRDDIYSIILSNEHFLQVECELGGIFSTPVIEGEYIVVTCADGTIYCLKK